MKISFANVASAAAFTDIRARWDLATNAGISRCGFFRGVQGFLGVLGAFLTLEGGDADDADNDNAADRRRPPFGADTVDPTPTKKH